MLAGSALVSVGAALLFALLSKLPIGGNVSKLLPAPMQVRRTGTMACRADAWGRGNSVTEFLRRGHKNGRNIRLIAGVRQFLSLFLVTKEKSKIGVPPPLSSAK